MSEYKRQIQLVFYIVFLKALLLAFILAVICKSFDEKREIDNDGDDKKSLNKWVLNIEMVEKNLIWYELDLINQFK